MSHCQPGNRRFGATEKAIEVSHSGMKSRAETNSRRRKARTRASISSRPSSVRVLRRKLGGIAGSDDLLDEALAR